MTDYHERQFTKEELKIIKENLYVFYRWFVVSNFEENITAPHIKDLAYKLMDLSTGKLGKSRIAIAMPPQHSKSSLATVSFASWLFLNNPKKRILVVNAEQGLSQNFGNDIRTLLYNVAPFFGLQVSSDTYSKTSMKLTKDGEPQSGSIQLTGAGGGITGRPVDYIIVDDPYKGLDEEFTPTALDKKWNWYTNLIEQRLRTKGRSKLVLLHTRWHSLDIQGRILDDPYQRSKYEFVTYPAISDDNKPLWGEYYDMEFYEDKQRTMGERQFQALYQQQPLDLTSDFFYMDHLHWDEHYTYLKDTVPHCRSYDMAYTSEKEALNNNTDADYTAGVYATKLNENHYIFTDFLYKRLGNRNIIKVQRIARVDGQTTPILIETGTTGGASKELFNVWDKDYLTDYKCIQSEPKGTKLDRATPLKNAMYDGKIHIYCQDQSLRKELRQQLESFPNGKHDDLIDAMSYAYNYLSKKSTGRTVATGGKRRRKRL